MLDGTPPFLFSVEPALPEGKKKIPPPQKKRIGKNQVYLGVYEDMPFKGHWNLGPSSIHFSPPGVLFSNSSKRQRENNQIISFFFSPQCSRHSPPPPLLTHTHTPHALSRLISLKKKRTSSRCSNRTDPRRRRCGAAAWPWSSASAHTNTLTHTRCRCGAAAWSSASSLHNNGHFYFLAPMRTKVD